MVEEQAHGSEAASGAWLNHTSSASRLQGPVRTEGGRHAQRKTGRRSEDGRTISNVMDTAERQGTSRPRDARGAELRIPEAAVYFVSQPQHHRILNMPGQVIKGGTRSGASAAQQEQQRKTLTPAGRPEDKQLLRSRLLTSVQAIIVSHQLAQVRNKAMPCCGYALPGKRFALLASVQWCPSEFGSLKHM